MVNDDLQEEIPVLPFPSFDNKRVCLNHSRGTYLNKLLSIAFRVDRHLRVIKRDCSANTPQSSQSSRAPSNVISTRASSKCCGPIGFGVDCLLAKSNVGGR